MWSQVKRCRIILGGWRWGRYMSYREQVMILSTIYGERRSGFVWWRWWILVAAFWWMIHARRLWEDGSKMEYMWWISSSTSCHLIGIFITAIRSNTTTTSGMHCRQLKIHGLLISGSVMCLLSFFSISEGNAFLILRYFYTMGCVRR